MRVQVVDLSINGDLMSEQIHVLWRDIDNLILTFWTRNLDFLPDIHAVYEFTPAPPQQSGTFKLIIDDLGEHRNDNLPNL